MPAAVTSFQAIIDRLTTTVQRDDLLPSYLDFANQAVRHIAEKYSFQEMKATGTGTVAIGQTRMVLPADFKELQAGRYPIFDAVPGSLVPVFSRTEVEKLLPVGLVPTNCFIYTSDATGGNQQYFIDLPVNAAVVHNVTLYYMAYPALCTDPANPANNSTPLIDKYFDMLLSKALSLAFQSINDPIYVTHERQFLMEYAQVTGDDVTQSLRSVRPPTPVDSK